VLRAGQLLVWEWRSEAYVLRQQGHYYDVSAVAFSPDGALIATGADDNKARTCRCCLRPARSPSCLPLP
jgi:periodic tryptophan protein 2